MNKKQRYTDFYDAAANSLNALQKQLPFGLWMFTQTNESSDEWIALATKDEKYGVSDGDVFKWSDSFCSRMVEGLGPDIAPDTNKIDAYKNAPIASYRDIASYIGVPLRTSNGKFFGTLCAIDNEVKDPVELNDNFYIVEALAKTLMLLYEEELELNEVKRSYEKLSLVSQTDDLTNVLNSRGWRSMLVSEELRCKRYATPCAIAIIDMNDLKAINDKHGHSVGDKQIIKLARTLESTVRESDVVARIGGDEFGVFIYNSSLDETKRLIKRIETDLKFNKIDAAVGYCQLSNANDFKEMTENADKDMYANKAQMKK